MAMIADFLNKPLTILLVELVFPEKFRAASLLLKYVTEAARNRGGMVIGTKGEKIVCFFGDCQAAIDTAQATLEQAFDAPDNTPLIRAALHFAPRVDSEREVAIATDLVAKAIGIAAAGEIVATKQTLAFLPRDTEFHRSTRTPPGARDEIYLIGNHPDPAQQIDEKTRLPGTLKFPAMAEKKVMVWMGHANTQLTLDKDTRVVTFGRDESNDMVIKLDSASRHHGYFEFRAGNVFVVDKSTNGTFMRSGGLVEKLCNNALPLPAEGYISLGGEAPGEHPFSIHFSTVASF